MSAMNSKHATATVRRALKLRHNHETARRPSPYIRTKLGRSTQQTDKNSKASSRSMDASSVVKLLVGRVGLSELPPRRRHVQELYVLPAGGSDGEAERLAGEPREGLPISAPVPRHLDPPGVGALDPSGSH